MINPLEITYYVQTGYSPSDEPASDEVIDLNEHWTLPLLLKEYDPANIQMIRVQISDEDMHRVDYLKIRDTVTDQRWYYYIAGHQRHNESVVTLRIIMDAFATVGLSNISFFGNVLRRSLSDAEAAQYALLPEPWAPRRPLKIRRMILDLNVNKTIQLPSHISTVFEDGGTTISEEQTINVPNSPIGFSTFSDSLSIQASLPMIYPNAAADTEHTINTPWGSLSYTTPYEQYYSLTGSTLSTFLEMAKKANALDLVEAPYYLPSPSADQSVTLTELENSNIRHPKASRYYTTVTIRSLSSNSTRTFTDNDTDLQYDQPLAVVIAPDKTGGIYVLPATLRDTGMNAYTYLEGVYSPFETVTYNAVGDTPAKFAADGTTLLNTALNNLFQTYINKTNALQYEGMQAKYFKGIGDIKGLVLPFAAELLGSISNAITKTEAHEQISNTSTDIPTVKQTGMQDQQIPNISLKQTGTTVIPEYTAINESTTDMPAIESYSSTDGFTSAFNTSSYGEATQYPYTYKQTNAVHNPSVIQANESVSETLGHSIHVITEAITSGYKQLAEQVTKIPAIESVTTTTNEGSSRSVKEGNDLAVNGMEEVYNSPKYGAKPTFDLMQTMLFGGYRNEVHSFMLGNINDYINRWVSIQNDMHNGKVANLFKNITLVGNYSDHNKMAGKYEIIIASLQPEDEYNFDLFLDHFGHAVDEYTTELVANVRDNFNYTMVGDDAILANSVKQDANGQILNQFRTGVRVWNKQIRPDNF